MAAVVTDEVVREGEVLAVAALVVVATGVAVESACAGCGCGDCACERRVLAGGLRALPTPPGKVESSRVVAQWAAQMVEMVKLDAET